MRIGKLDNKTLEELILSKFVKTRDEVFDSPRVGLDCARVRLDSGIAVLSCDPITAAESRIGYLTVHVNCNDAATAGAEPIGLLVTILAPPCTTKERLSALADEIAMAAHDVNVDIIGGHTEITSAVTRLVTSATVIAKPLVEALPNTVFKGDDIVMTKCTGLEGSAVLASDYAYKLTNIPDGELEVACSMIKQMSVVREGLFGAKHGAHCMHDITEGGVFGALWEMAYASNIGCVIDIEAINVQPITRKICDTLNINPYRLLSSGSMLIACQNGEEMCKGLRCLGIEASVIAKATDIQSGVRILNGDFIEPPESDELYKITDSTTVV